MNSITGPARGVRRKTPLNRSQIAGFWGAWAGWTLDGKVEPGPHAFAAITIYNKDPQAEAAGFPALLAPDDEQTEGNKVVQKWNLKDYRDLPIMLVCQYRNTKATLTRELPAELKTCVFRFEITHDRRLLAKPEVKCQ